MRNKTIILAIAFFVIVTVAPSLADGLIACKDRGKTAVNTSQIKRIINRCATSPHCLFGICSCSRPYIYLDNGIWFEEYLYYDSQKECNNDYKRLVKEDK